MWSYFYYHRKNEGYLKALQVFLGKLFRSFLKLYFLVLFLTIKKELIIHTDSWAYSIQLLGKNLSIESKINVLEIQLETLVCSHHLRVSQHPQDRKDLLQI